MEATAYSMNRGWNGVVTLTLEVRNGRRRVSSQRVAVRVAPWLMPNHLNPTEAVYVTNVGSDNARFRQMITTAATAAGVSTVNDPTYNDLWMQDIMELGYSTMPRVEAPGPASPQQAARWHLPVVLRTANDRSIEWNSTMDTYPRTRMVGQNFGYVEPQRPMDASSLDSFGNLECSPPVTVGRRRYRFGRIIYGTDGRRQMQHRVRTFLHAQRVQSPITFDTSWLAVGHVDEVMSFCPVPGYSPNRFKLLLASPLDALNICRRLARGSDANAPMFDGLAAAHSRFQSGTYDKATPAQVVGDHSFVSVQQVIQRRMNSIEGVLRRRLGLRSSDDVIKLPILFRRAGGGRYVAYTGGGVNMLVITRASGSAELCIPKPYGPVTGSPAAASGGTVGRPCEFERVIRDLLRHTGNGIHFIDDRGQEFITYHQGMGEVHCGTNSKRKPPVNGWWWEQEGI